MSGIERFTNDQLKKCVKEQFHSIVCSFDPNQSGVLDKLFGQEIITAEQYNKISDLPTEKERSRKLVIFLLEISHDTAISQFLEILHEVDAYKHIYDKIYASSQKKFACENEVCKNGERGGERRMKEFNNVNAPIEDVSSWDGKTKKEVRNCYTILKRNLDPLPVLDKLFEKDVIKLDRKQEIGCISNTEKCCEKLIDELLGMDERASAIFKDILKVEQPWLWNTLWLSPDSNDDRSLNLGEQNMIMRNIHCFKELLKPVDDCETKFLDRLLAEECITHSQNETILEISTREGKIAKLFTVMLRRSYLHYQRFIKCLKSTYQHNMAKILESYGIVLEVHVDCNNSEIEKYLADIITKTAVLEELGLQPKDKELIKQVLVKFEEKGIYIVGGTPTGSLIIYIQCSTEDSVNELENLFRNGQLKTELYILLNSVLADDYISDLEIRIDEREFERGRDFFQINLIHEQQAFHCFHGGELNDMSEVLVEIILKRASWIMWICFLVESLYPSSKKSLNRYLENGVEGFSSFVKVASSYIFFELSNVCNIWWQLGKTQKSFKRKLLSNILMTAIRTSFKILDDNLLVRERLSDPSFDQNLSPSEEKMGCDSKSIRSSNKLFQKVLKGKRFKHFLDLLLLLEQDCQHHLANHVMSFGVWLPCFGKKWPLDTKLKLIIASSGDISNRAINMNTPFYPEKSKQLQPSSEIQERKMSMGGNADDAVSAKLATLLFKKNCISAKQLDNFTHLDETSKKQMLWSLMENGSFEMYEIIIDYFSQTEQNDVAYLLQPYQEVRNYGKHVVNCLNKATDILDTMKRKITVPLLVHFEIKNHRVQFEKLMNYQKNEIILNILECSKTDVFIFFLNSLLATEQHVLLLPIFKHVPHRKLIENFQEYLVNTIDADSDFLNKLSSFCVINNVQLETIESKRTLRERNQELLNVISKSSPKSFYLFLSALVEIGRSNILKKLQLMHSGTSTNENNGTNEEVDGEMETDYANKTSDEEVGAETETDHENTSADVGMVMEIETDHGNKSEPDALKPYTLHRMVGSEEISKPTRDGEDVELMYAMNHEKNPDETPINLYTIEGRNTFGSKEDKKTSISKHIFFVIKNEARLPTDIRNILFLKRMAMSKIPSAEIKNLSRHLSCVQEYVQEMSDGFRGLSSNYTGMENLSLIIDPEEVKTGKQYFSEKINITVD